MVLSLNIRVWFYSDPSILDECGLDSDTKELLISNIRQKLTSQAVKIRADIEVACYGYEGIDAVKAALKTGLLCSTEEIPIKINLIAPPIYGKWTVRRKYFRYSSVMTVRQLYLAPVVFRQGKHRTLCTPCVEKCEFSHR